MLLIITIILIALDLIAHTAAIFFFVRLLFPRLTVKTIRELVDARKEYYA